MNISNEIKWKTDVIGFDIDESLNPHYVLTDSITTNVLFKIIQKIRFDVSNLVERKLRKELEKY